MGCRAAGLGRSTAPIGEIASFPSTVRFKHPWRKYQRRVLDELSSHLEDNALHVVAPPGSGKTVLGLEVARRLDRPTLIVSPTLTIRTQWVDRLTRLFLPETGDAPEWVSTDVRAPRFLTSTTYQSLHSAGSGLRQEGPTPEVSRGPAEPRPPAEALDLTSRLREAGTGTLILDEAHHLKNEWWKTLFALREALSGITVVAVTATPPYDVSYAEWQRYTRLCGPVDAEISVPELLSELDLCPHRDFVYFSLPAHTESKQIEDFHDRVADLRRRAPAPKSLHGSLRAPGRETSARVEAEVRSPGAPAPARSPSRAFGPTPPSPAGLARVAPHRLPRRAASHRTEQDPGSAPRAHLAALRRYRSAGLYPDPRRAQGPPPSTARVPLSRLPEEGGPHPPLAVGFRDLSARQLFRQLHQPQGAAAPGAEGDHLAVSPHQDRGGKGLHAIGEMRAAVGDDDRVGRWPFGNEGLDLSPLGLGVPSPIGSGDPDEVDAAVSILQPERLQQRHLRYARRAPRCPEVEHCDAPAGLVGTGAAISIVKRCGKGNRRGGVPHQSGPGPALVALELGVDTSHVRRGQDRRDADHRNHHRQSQLPQDAPGLAQRYQGKNRHHPAEDVGKEPRVGEDTPESESEHDHDRHQEAQRGLQLPTRRALGTFNVRFTHRPRDRHSVAGSSLFGVTLSPSHCRSRGRSYHWPSVSDPIFPSPKPDDLEILAQAQIFATRSWAPPTTIVGRTLLARDQAEIVSLELP